MEIERNGDTPLKPPSPSDPLRYQQIPSSSPSLPQRQLQVTHKHSWHLTDITWNPHYSKSLPWHPLIHEKTSRTVWRVLGKVKSRVIRRDSGRSLGCRRGFRSLWRCQRDVTGYQGGQRDIWECFPSTSYNSYKSLINMVTNMNYERGRRNRKMKVWGVWNTRTSSFRSDLQQFRLARRK